MSLRIGNVVEKCARTLVPAVVVVADSVSTQVLGDVSKTAVEYISRYVQNTGANVAYYSISIDCNPSAGVLTYHGMLAVGAQFVHTTAEPLFIYSVGGTTIATTIITRNDLTQHSNIVPS